MAFTNLASKLILNDKQINAGPLSNGFPFIKFAWTVEIQVGEEGEPKGIESTGPLVAKTCELPRFSIDTQVVNVYNHKTIVQTKMNYEPITMTFYDQTNSTAESLIWEYVNGQFDPTDASKKPGVLPLTIIITLSNLSGEGEDKVYTLKNAYIVDAQHDTLDYSTSDPVLWTLTVRYEDLETNEFKGETPGDGGAGIKALPKPPSKPVVGKLPDPPPVTKPPKSDAKDEAPYNNEWSDPMGTTDAYHIMNAAQGTKPAPEPTQKWPDLAESKNSAWVQAGGKENAETGAAWGNPTLARQAEKARQAREQSPSTGAAATKVQSPYSAQQAANARADYARNDPRRLDGESGLNTAYKEAYASEYSKYSRIYNPTGNSAQGEQAARNAADLKARVASPKYTSQVRTYNADGSMTDTYRPSQPQSVNNPTTAAAQQSRENRALSKNGDY
jgi:hypothetical protein